MKDKMLAMSIFFQSRKAYHVLSKVFTLPTPRTLLRDLQKMNIQPGFNNNLFEALKQRVHTLREQDKNIVLVFDEMSINGLLFDQEHDEIEGFEDFGHMGKTKYIANHVTVFMVHSLTARWKQPVGYFLSSGPIPSSMLQVLTVTCIDKVQKVGLKVRALLCDQGSNNHSFLHQLGGVSVEKPYMTQSNTKIFVFYDPPHLLKNVRNNLRKNDLLVKGEKVSWQDIVEFYKFDKKQPIQMAPKLTDKHLDLPPFMAMRVSLAAQVLSHSVAAGISTLVTCQYLPQKAQRTADFVKQFDTLFNVFNSRNLNSSQKLGWALSDDSGHISFLQETLEFLNTVQTTEGKELPCIMGWKLSVNALLGLWHTLKTEASFKFLLTNRLNQDCVENLFSIICGRGCFSDNPDCQQFRAALKFVVADKLFVQSDGTNCKVDDDQILLDIASVSMARSEKGTKSDTPKQLATGNVETCNITSNLD